MIDGEPSLSIEIEPAQDFNRAGAIVANTHAPVAATRVSNATDNVFGMAGLPVGLLPFGGTGPLFPRSECTAEETAKAARNLSTSSWANW